ncbi:MAG TPA: DUF4384 domain-containing protein [Candidatus Angelobacter sp.]
MSKAVSRMKCFCGLLVWAFAFAILAGIAFASTAQETGTRGVTPEEFVKARPANTGTKSTTHPGYKLVSTPLKAGNGDMRQMGITIWRLRASASQDGGPRILVQEGAESISWTPHRVAAGSLLREGDRVRISIESPSTGYLYVIDREQYSGGKLGEPYLIFPTTRIRNGDNQVTAGKLVEVPAQEDRPNYFTLRKSKPGQTGEVLTMVVSDKPLEDLNIGAEARVLSAGQVEEWEKKWKGQTQRFEMVGGLGRAWTKAEQEAGLDGTRRLTQDDPGPQTVYRVAVPAGRPFLAQVELGYSAPKAARVK